MQQKASSDFQIKITKSCLGKMHKLAVNRNDKKIVGTLAEESCGYGCNP